MVKHDIESIPRDTYTSDCYSRVDIIQFRIGSFGQKGRQMSADFQAHYIELPLKRKNGLPSIQWQVLCGLRPKWTRRFRVAMAFLPFPLGRHVSPHSVKRGNLIADTADSSLKRRTTWTLQSIRWRQRAISHGPTRNAIQRRNISFRNGPGNQWQMMTEGRFVGFDGNLIDEKAMKTQSIFHISGFKRIIKQTEMKGLCLPFRTLFLFQSKNKIWPMRINLLLVRFGCGGLWEI